MARYTRGKAVQLTKNFKSTEFDCKCGKCKDTLIDTKLVNLLQKVRDYYNKPVIINSGFRCAAHNKAVGGATTSQHTLGRAADIRITGVTPSTIADYAEKIGFDGIGRYSTFTHVDTRGYKARWWG